MAIKRALFLCVFLAAAFYVSSEFLLQLRLADLKEQIFWATDADAFHAQAAIQDFSALYKDSNSLLNKTPNNPEAWFLKGRIALMLALASNSVSQTQSLTSLCSAWQSFKRAAELSPRNPSYQIAWADAEAQLKNPKLLCNVSNSGLDPLQRLAWAKRLAPNSTTELYLSALVHLAIGDKQEALRVFRSLQEMDPNFTSSQRDYVYRQVKTEQDLRTAAPAKFPGIVHWINYFASERPHEFLAWRASFAEAVDGAITELEDRLRKEKLSQQNFSNFIKMINYLPITTTTEHLRRRLDAVLARLYVREGEAKWAEMLRYRMSLMRVPVLKALIADDKVPSNTMLFGWTSDRETNTAFFDYLGHSLGLYLPRGYSPTLLILETTEPGVRLGERDLELLFSHDNLEFFPLQERGEAKTFLVDGRERMVIELERADFRYLKVRYRGANRKPRFSNKMSELVQVYGRQLS